MRAILRHHRAQPAVLRTRQSVFSIQTGQVRIKGAELEVLTSVTPNLDLIGAYAYTDARIESGDNAGKRVASVPQQQASLWGKYRLASLGLRDVTVGAGVRYIGESWDGIDTAAHAGLHAVRRHGALGQRPVAAAVQCDQYCRHPQHRHLSVVRRLLLRHGPHAAEHRDVSILRPRHPLRSKTL
jgi:hypothetical protein